MSARLFQGIIHQLKDTTDRTIGVIDNTGTVIASSELAIIGQTVEEISVEAIFSMPLSYHNGYTYKPIQGRGKTSYAVFIEGTDEQAAGCCGILAVSLNNIKYYYDEKYDKSNFIKNVILDNILPGDIYIKAKELHFTNDVPRAVFVVRVLERTEVPAVDILDGMFPNKQKDYVVSISETDSVVIKEVKPNISVKELESIGRTIVDTVNSELLARTMVGIGTVAIVMQDLAKSFKEAQTAMDVGKVFDVEKNIISYENLGIGRIIYQLPTTLCEMFLSEVFKSGGIEQLDQETLFTIQKFFENNLNVSETSRKLFVHRNTLVYRLEKIKKITGLDLREFDHAIVFKVAMMVKKYLTSVSKTF